MKRVATIVGIFLAGWVGGGLAADLLAVLLGIPETIGDEDSPDSITWPGLAGLAVGISWAFWWARTHPEQPRIPAPAPAAMTRTQMKGCQRGYITCTAERPLHPECWRDAPAVEMTPSRPESVLPAAAPIAAMAGTKQSSAATTGVILEKTHGSYTTLPWALYGVGHKLINCMIWATQQGEGRLLQFAPLGQLDQPAGGSTQYITRVEKVAGGINTVVEVDFTNADQTFSVTLIGPRGRMKRIFRAIGRPIE